MMITLRETALTLLLRPPDTLNQGVPTLHAPSDLPLALAAALKALKAAAITDQGVDYGALKHHPAYTDYHALTGQLPTFDPTTLPDRAAALAFWINLYNGLIIDGVMAFAIRRSVTEKMAGLGFFRRAAYTVGGQRLTPDDIEHGILRGNRKHPVLPGRQFRHGDPRLAWAVNPLDPRIHFALNCASRSCPPIGAYDAARIDDQLTLATRNFIDAETEIDPTSGRVVISQIFRWYAPDFGGEAGVRAFLAAYLPEGDRKRAAATAKIAYRTYDWRLNTV